MNAPRKLRCAVYTRKSNAEGLQQDFNSLDAQREACESYIASQRSEGWVALRERYDDGGFSGGNMERPGLKSLLEDVRNGLVDVIVVYKIDRLSRSLADFASWWSSSTSTRSPSSRSRSRSAPPPQWGD